MTWETWRCGELAFTAQEHYNDPLMDLDMTVSFRHTDGTTLTRYAFWDGGSVWRVRFAPTKAGLWTWTTACTNRRDAGLHGLSGSFSCAAYTGDLAIYRHGFVKVSENKRYFVYDDGTPFLYLGDTHWLMAREHFDDANVEGVDSQFKFCVDYRLTEGFTVYQSEPLEAKLNFADGLGEDDVKEFQENLDRKFRYIADRGLLHANAQFFFAPTIQYNVYNAQYLNKMAVYWGARYGAYPVLWTVAQEVDPDFYGGGDMTKWFGVAETLYRTDCYQHPLTAHMCNENRCKADNTLWGSKYYHSWFGMQPQNAPTAYFESFWNYKTAKPMVYYETGYEELWNPRVGAVNAGYRALLLGCCGYGYGAHGVWNADNDIHTWMDYDGYKRWFEGMLLKGGNQLQHFMHVFSALPWYDLTPCFNDDAQWAVRENAYCAHKGTELYLVYDASGVLPPVTLKGLNDTPYYVSVFSSGTGELLSKGTVTPENGTVTLPKKPTPESWLYIVSAEPFVLPLTVSAEETLFAFKGQTLALKASEEGVAWRVEDPTFADVDKAGNVTAKGKAGLFAVVAEKDGRTARQFLLAVRQDKESAPAGPEKLVLLPQNHGKPCTELVSPMKYLNLLPEITPADGWYQNYELILTDEKGETCYTGSVNGNYQFFPFCDGKAVVRLRAQNGVESEPVTIVSTGYGALGKLSLWTGAAATCDDYHPLYDPRCMPQRAVNGSTKNFSGWTSEKTCSPEDPAILIITPKTPVKINTLEIYTTGAHYLLKDFDVLAVENRQEICLGTVRDNKSEKIDLSFAAITPEKLLIRCYKGDREGHARVDQVNAYFEE